MGRELEVHAAHRPLETVPGGVHLGDQRRHAVLLELALAEHPGEVPAAVVAGLQVDDERALEPGFLEFHLVRSSSFSAAFSPLRNDSSVQMYFQSP